MTQNHRFAWRVDCVRAWGPLRASLIQKVAAADRIVMLVQGTRAPATRFRWVITCRNATCKAAFRGPISSLGEKEKDEGAICWRTKKGHWKKREKKDEDREITATNHRLPIWRELIIICAQRNPAVMIASRTCLLELNENLRIRDSCKFCVLGNKVNRAWISLGIAG